MLQKNYTVARVGKYARAKVTHMERHNERKNQQYGNTDVDLARSEYNVHFKRYSGTYLEAFDKLVIDGVISTKGHKQDGSNTIINELIFDVNSEYFEEQGGYDYAKSFFEASYRMAVKEAGGEQFILSAVLHADERNSRLSEKLGKDVYHYHLHVVFIPTVDKEIKWSKRCKDPALIGTTKAIIKQVSHSKKWASEVIDGKQVKSYSLLQDRYYSHMIAAGFDGFERGERGSTAEHLDVLNFKIKKDKQRVSELDDALLKSEAAKQQLDENIAQKQGELNEVKSKIHATKTTHDDLEKMASSAPFPFKDKVLLTEKDWDKAKKLAKQGVDAPQIIAKYNEQFQTLKETKDALKEKQNHLHASDKKLVALKMELQDLHSYKAALELLPEYERAQLLRAARVSPQQRAGVHER